VGEKTSWRLSKLPAPVCLQFHLASVADFCFTPAAISKAAALRPQTAAFQAASQALRRPPRSPPAPVAGNMLAGLAAAAVSSLCCASVHAPAVQIPAPSPKLHHRAPPPAHSRPLCLAKFMANRGQPFAGGRHPMEFSICAPPTATYHDAAGEALVRWLAGSLASSPKCHWLGPVAPS